MPLTQVQGGMLAGSTNTTTTIQSNGTTAITIDSSQNVGIGTASPDAKLKVVASGANLLVGFSGTQNYFDASENIFRNFAGTERMRIGSNGDILVGATSWSPTVNSLRIDGPSNALGRILSTCNGDFNFELYGSQSNRMAFYSSAGGTTRVGTITTSTTNTSYNTSSDYRLKENIAPMTGALATVAQLKPCTYTWKVDGSNGQGFIAHELQAVVPDAVSGEKDGEQMQGVDTSYLVATLTAAIQELNAKVEAQATEIAALKAAT